MKHKATMCSSYTIILQYILQCVHNTQNRMHSMQCCNSTTSKLCIVLRRMPYICYSNYFMHKDNSCSQQPDHWSIDRCGGLQKSFKFKRDQTCRLSDNNYGIIKIMVIPYILYCGGQGCPPQYKMYDKTTILKMPYLIICICTL